ncbi:MAG: hypothetical protein R3C14_36550 [Caldilineaceae bacterium]
MCRFLLVKAATPVQPAALLAAFADLAEHSYEATGAWQGDGWGVSWLDEAKRWRGEQSLQPIWTERGAFTRLPPSPLWLVHARSASFPHHQAVLAYNQPYFTDEYAFVFNGFLQGVKLPQRLPGTIGAQKIWALLQQHLRTAPPAVALEQVRVTLLEHSRSIKALNIGLADRQGAYAFCCFAANPEYYTLHLHRSPTLQMICSEPLAGYEFSPVAANQVVMI